MELPQQLKQYIAKRWAKVTAISIIILAVIVSLLPVVVKMIIKDWYQDQGVESVAIDDVDLNLFAGTFVLEGVEVKANTQVVLSTAMTAVNISWLDLLSRNIHIEEIDLKDFFIYVDRPIDGPMKVAGIVIGDGEPSSEEPPAEKGEPWGFGITVTKIDNFALHYKDDKLDSEFKLKKANLDNAFTWTPDNHAVLAIHGEVNSSPVSIDAEIKPFATNPGFQGKLKIEGVKLDDFAELARPRLASLSGKLHIDSLLNASLTGGNLLDVKAEGEYRLDEVVLELDEQKVELGVFRIAGSTEVKQPVGSTESQKQFVSFAGNSALQGLSVQDKKADIMLVELGELAVNSIDINELEDIRVAELALTGLVLVGDNRKTENREGDENRPVKNSALAVVKSVKAEKIALKSFNQLAIQSLDLHQVRAHISKDRNGKIELLNRLGSEESKPEKDKDKQARQEKPEEAGAAENSGFQFSVSRVSVSDKSGIVFKDASVLPKFETSVDLEKLEVTNIDNTSKQGESPFLLKAKLNKHSEFDIKGKLKLFSGDNDFSLVARLKNYEMPPLSSYTSQLLGYDLASGHGNMDIHAEKNKDKIDGEIKLKLNNLTVKETNPEYMEKLNQQLSIPLGLALSLLRDSNDDIKLQIPVTGEMLKPDVGIGDIINTALGNALKASTMAYLKFAFQPFGTLITIAQVAGSAVSTIKLDPVAFSLAGSDLRADSNDYLQKIARLIQDRKGIRIKLCGVSTVGDREELLRIAAVKQAEESAKQKKGSSQAKDSKLPPPTVTDDEMFELARKRAESVKDHLITVHKIDPARLFVCHPEIKKEKEAKPVVELMM